MALSNIDRAFHMLDSFGSQVDRLPPVDEKAVVAAEKHLGVYFPASYRQLLTKKCGAMAVGELRIFGLGGPWDGFPSVVWATELLRAANPNVPRTLVTLDVLDTGQFVCLECESSQPDKNDGSVVCWDPDTSPSDCCPKRLANDFGAYLLEQLNGWLWLQASLAQLRWHIENPESEWDHQTGGRLPRNHLWRPYRFCVQDVILGLTVLRHSRECNCLEVDVFLTTAIAEYEADSGARALAVLLLSEAYKCGGTMEIRFTKNVEEKRVPRDLVDLAQAVGAPLQHVGDGVITPAEARGLYAALTGFSPQLRAHIEALERAGQLSVPLTCYTIHHGLWERAEVEAILLTSPRPGSLLSGQARPEQRHLYLHDLLYGRAAVLFGSLDRHLRYRAHSHESGVIHLEDDERPLELHLDGGTYAATYRCPQETVAIPWVVTPAGNGTVSDDEHKVPPGQPFTVLVRARDATDLAANLESDLQQAARVGRMQDTGPVYVLVPRDFYKLSDDQRKHLIQNRPKPVGLLVYRQFVSALDDEVARRLRASRVMRA